MCNIQQKNINYLKMEQPVIFFELMPGMNSLVCDAINEILSKVHNIGIHNAVIILDGFDSSNLLLPEFFGHNINVQFRANAKIADNVCEIVHAKNPASLVFYDFKDDFPCDQIFEQTRPNTPIIINITNETLNSFNRILTNIQDAENSPIIVSWKPNFSADNDNLVSWKELDLLYCKLIDHLRTHPQANIRMDYGILPTRLLLEHPCNAYMCSGKTCHSNKNNLPRRLYVDSNGNIFPEHYSLKDYNIGNILQNDFLSTMYSYKDSSSHKKFLDLSKLVYTQWVETCPYRVIPWSELLVHMSKNM